MGFEVENKFRVADHGGLRRRLAEWGAEAGPAVEQEDVYLAHPARDFAATDEALRLRRLGDENRITYKGPKRGGPAKTREEVEVPFADGPGALADMARVFEALGFRPVATIRKSRTSYHLERDGRPIEVALDLADGLGAFAEVEALAADEADLADAQRAVTTLAEALGLTDLEPRSYLRMGLEAARRNSSGPS
ncbi:MAG TPA: class IV adenylate cyclase [Isosphaeraceae bacterium]|jgi:adenylate cyclase class 2|nr:class IV adenylate cyclase [Isosphaeraceae bacterium]